MAATGPKTARVQAQFVPDVTAGEITICLRGAYDLPAVGRAVPRPRRVPTPATAVPDGADISQAAPDTRPATLGGLVMPLAAL